MINKTKNLKFNMLAQIGLETCFNFVTTGILTRTFQKSSLEMCKPNINFLKYLFHPKNA